MINKEFSCNIFLYPEKAVKVTEKTKDRVMKLFDLNRIEYKTTNEDPEDTRPLIDDELLVKVWCSSDDFDNLSRFGLITEEDNKMYKIKIDEYLPARFFYDYREGDTINRKINLSAYVSYEYTYNSNDNNNRIPLSKRKVEWYNGEAPEFLFKFSFTLSQEQYKYNDLGPFQKALKWCCKID